MTAILLGGRNLLVMGRVHKIYSPSVNNSDNRKRLPLLIENNSRTKAVCGSEFETVLWDHPWATYLNGHYHCFLTRLCVQAVYAEQSASDYKDV